MSGKRRILGLIRLTGFEYLCGLDRLFHIDRTHAGINALQTSAEVQGKFSFHHFQSYFSLPTGRPCEQTISHGGAAANRCNLHH